MDPLPVFLAQFLWSLVAWSTLAATFVLPRIDRLPREEALAICMAPQLFRVLGLGLLVPNLSPGLPMSFAIPTAIGDSTTSVLALLTFLALKRGSAHAWTAAWACTIVGLGDLAIALPHAASINAALYLEAQWYVPVVGVPLMLVSHFCTLRVLLRRRNDARHH